MKIWIDADSCPVRIREIIIKASLRRDIPACFVANRNIPLPAGDLISMIIVGDEEGAADNYIINNVNDNDLVITRDIPLAAELVDKNSIVMNDRGTLFTRDNIREKLSIRNMMKDFRESGIVESGGNGFSAREIKDFSNLFDRELHKLCGGTADHSVRKQRGNT